MLFFLNQVLARDIIRSLAGIATLSSYHAITGLHFHLSNWGVLFAQACNLHQNVPHWTSSRLSTYVYGCDVRFKQILKWQETLEMSVHYKMLQSYGPYKSHHNMLHIRYHNMYYNIALQIIITYTIQSFLSHANTICTVVPVTSPTICKYNHDNIIRYKLLTKCTAVCIKCYAMHYAMYFNITL